MQVHRFKFETNFVLSGSGLIQVGREGFPCDAFLAGEMSAQDVDEYLVTMVDVPLFPGDVLDVRPGQVHRVVAHEDLTFIEASSPELDDVIRLFDDTNRGHGRITSEHAN